MRYETGGELDQSTASILHCCRALSLTKDVLSFSLELHLPFIFNIQQSGRFSRNPLTPQYFGQKSAVFFLPTLSHSTFRGLSLQEFMLYNQMIKILYQQFSPSTLCPLPFLVSSQASLGTIPAYFCVPSRPSISLFLPKVYQIGTICDSPHQGNLCPAQNARRHMSACRVLSHSGLDFTVLRKQYFRVHVYKQVPSPCFNGEKLRSFCCCLFVLYSFEGRNLLHLHYAIAIENNRVFVLGTCPNNFKDLLDWSKL